jgi:DNA-binding transcriptional LysR family regulator
VDLEDLIVFTRVVERGSFTGAAAALRMPKSTVSRKVSDLEARLNARLLQRTTRRLSLTDAGRTYFDYATRIVSEVEEAERAVGSLQETPRGRLRVAAGMNSTFLGDIIADYLKRYPEVQLELFCTGRTVDLIEERFDVGIRAGTLPDSTLIARSLGRVSRLFVATSAYLKKRGRPRSPDDLARHDCLLYGVGLTTVDLRFESGDKSVERALPGRLIVSDLDILHSVAAAGCGIALLPAFRCVEDLRARRFERVLRDWTVPSIPVHAMYPTARHIAPKVKSFVDHLQKRMTPPPWELGPMP